VKARFYYGRIGLFIYTTYCVFGVARRDWLVDVLDALAIAPDLLPKTFEETAVYEKQYAVYRELYPALSAIFKKL